MDCEAVEIDSESNNSGFLGKSLTSRIKQRRVASGQPYGFFSKQSTHKETYKVTFQYPEYPIMSTSSGAMEWFADGPSGLETQMNSTTSLCVVGSPGKWSILR